MVLHQEFGKTTGSWGGGSRSKPEQRSGPVLSRSGSAVVCLVQSPQSGVSQTPFTCHDSSTQVLTGHLLLNFRSARLNVEAGVSDDQYHSQDHSDCDQLNALPFHGLRLRSRYQQIPLPILDSRPPTNRYRTRS